MTDKKVDNTYYPYKNKKEYSLLLVIKDKELYFSSPELHHLGYICRHILDECIVLGILLRPHFCYKNRILCLYLSEGYYSPIAALGVIRAIERYVPESVLLKYQEQIKSYTKYFNSQVISSFRDILKSRWFTPSKKNKAIGFISDKNKINRTVVNFIDSGIKDEKYAFSADGSNHTYSLVLRKLISVYSDTTYENIFYFNDVSIDIKYKNLFLKFWEERNGKIEKVD